MIETRKDNTLRIAGNAAVLTALTAALLLAGCGNKEEANQTPPPSPAPAGGPATPAPLPPGAGANRPDMTGPGPGMAPGGAPVNYGGRPK